MRFELHCHSICSDGTERPDQVAARADHRGVAVFALTDHDTCAGSGVPVPGARVLRPVRVSCEHEGRRINVIAYDRGGDAWRVLDELRSTHRALIASHLEKTLKSDRVLRELRRHA